MNDDPDGINARVFRALVVTGATADLLWFALYYFAPRSYSQTASELLQWNGYEALLPQTPVYPFLCLFLHVASSVSLYRFSRPGRLVFTALIVINTAVAAASGLCVSTGFESLIGSFVAYPAGAVIAMAWTPPLSDRFRTSSRPIPHLLDRPSIIK